MASDPVGDGRQQRPSCRLVALDGNGTLIKDDGVSVSEYTREVLGRVQDLGIPVVLVSGRSLEKARSTLELVGLRQYVITENGVRAMRIQDGHALFELWLEGPEAAEPLRRVRSGLGDVACSFAQLSADGGIIEESHPWLRAEGEPKDVTRKLFAHIVPDVVQALGTGRRCAKCYVTVESSMDFVATMKQIEEAAGEGWSVRQIKQLLPGGTTNTCEVQSDRVNKAQPIPAKCRATKSTRPTAWRHSARLSPSLQSKSGRLATMPTTRGCCKKWAGVCAWPTTYQASPA